MAKISETELQRKLRNAKTSSGTTGGRTAVQKDGVWEYTSPVIYTAYADNITNRSTTGKIPSQADAAGFQLEPHDAGGELLDWRGHLFSTSIYESGDPTDYTWELADYTGVTTSFERNYTTSTKLLVDVGNPTFPGTGITWTSIASNLALPDNAYFVAERYTIKGATSAWMVYPVAVEESGFGVISYTIGTNKPVLGDAQWNIDVVVAVSSYTGRSYSTIKEFGYGTTVVINYNDGKLYGTLKKVSGSPAWVAAGSFIDGDLVVDGTVVADKIGANAVTAGKLLITGSGNVSEVITPAYIGAPTTAALATVIGDVATAQSTADGKINSYFQDAAPTSLTASDEGDLWTDTLAANNNESYRWSGTAWEAIADGGIADAIASAATAQSTADGKVTTFYHDDPPTAEGEGDLWVDTNDSNKLHRWNGSAWLDIHDTTYSSIGSITGGISASQVANAVNTNSTTVDGGKITAASIGASHLIVSGANAVELDGLKTFRQTTSPTAENEGDLWYDSDDHNKLYRWDGSTWVSNQDNTVADNIYSSGTTYINGGIITTDTITGNHINAGVIDAGHLDTDSVTVDKIDVDGQLDISDQTGSFTFKKTAYSDYATNGVFLGNRSGSTIPVFLAGNTDSYIQVDDGGVVIVGADFADSTTITTPALPNSPTEYSVYGIYYFAISSAYATLTFKLSGGGGGGGGATSGSGSGSNGGAGSQTTVQVLTSENSVVSTWTANGGSAGAGENASSSQRTGANFSISPADTLFSGTGGNQTPADPSGNSEHNGQAGQGNSSGGEGGASGSHLFGSDNFGAGGSAGSYSTGSYSVTNSTYYLKITIGDGGYAGSGSSNGGKGASGAARISVTLV